MIGRLGLSWAVCSLPETDPCSCPADHPGGNPKANLKSISHRCYPRVVTFEWKVTKETIYLPLGCLQGGSHSPSTVQGIAVARGLQTGFATERSPPHGGVRSFHQKSTCRTQSTFGPCVVQIWSRYVQRSERTKHSISTV